MKKRMGRGLFLALALMLLLGLGAASARAEGALELTFGYHTNDGRDVVYNTLYFNFLHDALAAANDGYAFQELLPEEEQEAFSYYFPPRLRLLEDLENDAYSLELNDYIVLDLNGHTLTLSEKALAGDGEISIESAVPGTLNIHVDVSVSLYPWTGDTINITGGSITGFVGVDGGTVNISGGTVDDLFVNNGGDADIVCTISGNAMITKLFYAVYLDEEGSIQEGCHSAMLCLQGGYYAQNPETFKTGQMGGDPFDQSAYVSFLADSVEAYAGQEDWLADGETYPWRVKSGAACLHPNAVTAFNWEGHWLYCPDCGQGVPDSFEEHFPNWTSYRREDIQTVRVTVPGMEQTEQIPANMAMGVGNTVSFIGENKTFTYLPDNSGKISAMDDATESLYIPGGFATSPDDPGPETPNFYSVMIPGAAMEMIVEYEDCGYGMLEILIAHGSRGKIWANKWFAAAGETVTFGTSDLGGYRSTIVVKSGDTVIPYTQGEWENTFTMPQGNVTLEVTYEQLPTLTLPASMKTVEESAFEGCGAYFIIVPEDCEHIGAYAFKNCPNLEALYVTGSETTIDDTALDGCTDVCVYGHEESGAHDFASKNYGPCYFWAIEELAD